MNGSFAFEPALSAMLQASRYAERVLAGDASLIDDLRKYGCEPLTRQAVDDMARSIPGAGGEEAFHRSLRQLRRRVLMRIIFRDIARLADLNEVVTAISALADVAVELAVTFHQRAVAHELQLSAAQCEDARAQLLVVGMGKLGAHELNVSSDIDLIFIHAEDGDATADRSWHQFHSDVGKRVIRAIDEVTADGFVFRVDMRLRPYGASGALVTSLLALDEYFRAQGRPWERYAWLKARAITGHPTTVQQLQRQMSPFVYRRYHDYAAIAEMRELHAQIRAEATKRNRLNDIKVGPGGIREVEFVVQMHQLIRGGRETRLCVSSTREAMTQIAALGLLDAARIDRLREAYVFLRNLEHRLQYVDDAQTQALPTGDAEQARIARAMGFADWAAFASQLSTHRQAVSAEFDAVFAKSNATSNDIAVTNTMPTSAKNSSIHGAFQALSPEDAHQQAMLERINLWRTSSRTASLTPKVRAQIEALIPAALTASLAEDQSKKTFFRVFDLIEAVDKRATYIALLAEFPGVLQRVARIAAKSAWAAELLRRHPVLLDELVPNQTRQSTAIDWPAQRRALESACAQHHGDTERLYEVLRHTKQTLTLKLNIDDIEGRLGVMALSDELTALADMLLAVTLDLAWRALGHAGSPEGFAIIGYGKLGSKELGYASDLDLVFLYDAARGVPVERYAKLAQRLSSWLNTMTAGGVLYETDLRLRPDGASGMLVSSLEAFRDYQLHRAWTWEHQALTRARWCAGDSTLAGPFDAIRDEVLSQPRDRHKLAEEIIAMRNKMRAEKKDRPDALDLKHTRGGIVDVEFIVQFLILAYAHEHREFLKNLGNFALLTRAGALGILDENIAASVGKAYLAYRERQHIARNNNEEKTWIGLSELETERRAVVAAWGALFGIVT
jgi:[glutamine synthetase] adenylyltransferase / [glutamine synthetase]-adenylyl-L-tyrosine phosphorylase